MMLIGGVQKLTLIDYPGKLAAILFTQGCPLRCPFCHNSEVVVPEKFKQPISEEEIFKFLKSRVGKLEGIVISGGEPTIQDNLPLFIRKIKELGFLVKLDTSGINPQTLLLLIRANLLDYVAMDLKAPLEKYSRFTGKEIDIEKIKKSINIILNSKIPYEFRTTLLENFHDFDDVIIMAKTIEGADLYALQKFIPSSTLNPQFLSFKSFDDDILQKMRIEAEKLVKVCLIR
jgi:pyruvate formate lyase activating enzyme